MARVLDTKGDGSTSDVIAALNWCVAQGAQDRLAVAGPPGPQRHREAAFEKASGRACCPWRPAATAPRRFDQRAASQCLPGRLSRGGRRGRGGLQGRARPLLPGGRAAEPGGSRRERATRPYRRRRGLRSAVRGRHGFESNSVSFVPDGELHGQAGRLRPGQASLRVRHGGHLRRLRGVRGPRRGGRAGQQVHLRQEGAHHAPARARAPSSSATTTRATASAASRWAPPAPGCPPRRCPTRRQHLKTLAGQDSR